VPGHIALRGKVLNTWEVDRDRLFANTEIHDISVAIGVDPHGPNDTPDLSGLRYGKVCILSDADVDGSHIQVLLLTLFFRHFPKLIETGHVFVARPPLFRVDAPARGKKPASKAYALDDGELVAILDKLRKEGVREGAWTISRFKGLGEMNAEQLWDTTLNPDTRRLLPVTWARSILVHTEALITKLMGKGEAAARRELMELHGDSVEVDICGRLMRVTLLGSMDPTGPVVSGGAQIDSHLAATQRVHAQHHSHGNLARFQGGQTTCSHGRRRQSIGLCAVAGRHCNRVGF
jgi:topoisomerase-4 subunit B